MKKDKIKESSIVNIERVNHDLAIFNFTVDELNYTKEVHNYDEVDDAIRTVMSMIKHIPEYKYHLIELSAMI